MAEPLPIQFAGQAYAATSLPLDAQVCINWYLEKSPAEAKTQTPLFGCPGIAPFENIGRGPVWGLYPFQGDLLVVSGQELWSLPPDGFAVKLGNLSLIMRPSMTDNGTQVVFVDGVTGWIYQPGGVNFQTTDDQPIGSFFVQVLDTQSMAGGDTLNIEIDDGSIFTTTIQGITLDQLITLNAPLPGPVSLGNTIVDPAVIVAQITSPSFFPANSVTYFDTYFIFNKAGTNQFFTSFPGDGTQYNSTFSAQAEADPDFLLGVVQLHEMLLLLGSKHIETWYDAGTLDFPFARFDGGTIQRGLAAPRAFCVEDNTLFWLGEDIVFYRLNAFTPMRVSNHAMEQAWQKYGTVSDAFCMNLTWNGHKWIVVTFPSAGQTWVFDVASGLWHQRVSWNALNQDVGGWRVNSVQQFGNHIAVGDGMSGLLGFLNEDTFTEWGNTLPAIVTSPQIHGARARLFWSVFEADIETGVGTTVDPGADPMMVLDWSDDGGRTWSMVQPPRSMGKQGEYRRRLRWTRMGQARQRMLRLTVTAPVKRALIGTYAKLTPGLP